MMQVWPATILVTVHDTFKVIELAKISLACSDFVKFEMEKNNKIVVKMSINDIYILYNANDEKLPRITDRHILLSFKIYNNMKIWKTHHWHFIDLI